MLKRADEFDAVLAGVSKCGTTTLIKYFNEHPDIFVPWNKEKDRDPRWLGVKWEHVTFWIT